MKSDKVQRQLVHDASGANTDLCEPRCTTRGRFPRKVRVPVSDPFTAAIAEDQELLRTQKRAQLSGPDHLRMACDNLLHESRA